ncbi:MAG: metallophosphoesterase family protein [Thermodesulfobacteriota bacterium]
MRIALISDLHGNEVALRAVLADAERARADRIICLGDVATLGPRPNEVIAILRELGCPCIVGNHDAFLLEPRLVEGYTDAAVVLEAIEWCRAQLTADEIAFLRSFVPTAEVPLDSAGTLFLFHGSPRSHTEDLLATMPPEELDEALGGVAGTVLAGGHTHLQMLRQHDGRLLVNPGSVGMPFKEYVGGRTPTVLSHAEYAIVEVERGVVGIDLRRVPLERAALRAAAEASGNPFRAMLLRQYA